MSETVLYKNDAVKKLKKRAKVRREIIGTLMIGFIAFTLFPMVISFIVSFHDLHSYNMKYMEYCGWDNYKKIFAIGKFSDIQMPLSLWESIKNTLLFSLCVPINLVTAVFLANIISKKLPGNKFMRVVLFIPQVCSGVAVTLVWQWIFEDNFGVLNTLLAVCGGNSVHVRSGRGTKHNVLATLRKGDLLLALPPIDGWCEITYVSAGTFRQGYMSAKYVASKEVV